MNTYDYTVSSLADIEKQLGTSLEKGLTSEQARALQEKYGLKRDPRSRIFSLCTILFANLNLPLLTSY